MIDREKVVKSIEEAIQNFERYSGDEYGREYDYARVEVETLEAALALLRAQEPDENWISRKRLRDEIQYYIEEAGWGDEVNKVLGWCLEFIDNQEAVKWE